MYKLVFFVPESHLKQTKQAVFAAGAGRIGNYEACCWQTKGMGQFRPLVGSDPYLGEVGEVELVEEWRVELVCADEYIKQVITELKSSHPYEEVAYDVWQLASI